MRDSTDCCRWSKGEQLRLCFSGYQGKPNKIRLDFGPDSYSIYDVCASGEKSLESINPYLVHTPLYNMITPYEPVMFF